MFKDTKEGQTNSYTPIAQVVIEAMKEFDEIFDHDPDRFYENIKFHINKTIIKVLEAIEKEVDEKFTVYYRSKFSQDCSRNETEKEKSTEMIDLSDIQQLLNSTKEQIK